MKGGELQGGGCRREPDARPPPARLSAFEVHLDVFEGPFDLLLGLISKHKLDITEVSLSKVTDEFIAYIRQRSGGWDLDQVSYFLVVAATLLDLKAARLLPPGRWRTRRTSRCWRRGTCCSPGSCSTGPTRRSRRCSPAGWRRRPGDSRAGCRLSRGSRNCSRRYCLRSAPEFAALAARTMTPKRPPTVSVDHIHQAFVSIREQAVFIAGRLALGRASFRQLTAGARGNYEIVASFLALLELYREDVVAFEQIPPLGDLYVSWTGGRPRGGARPPGAGGDEAHGKRSDEDYT